MQVNGFILNINSEQPGRLLEFYRDVVGLEPDPGVGDAGLHAGPITLVFDGHSEVQGSTKEPARVLVNLFVDDVESAQKELEAKGVSFTRKLGKEYWGGIISTFTDPDGNYCQIIEYRAP